uniref:Sulfotransferase n=1 Tax=Leptobrachium leishanense TaxID=445787 RepID=A0A8C5R112_9ANUR
MSPTKGRWISPQKCLGVGKFFSLLIGLVITVLVVASYVLNGGRQDLGQPFSSSTARDFGHISNLSYTEIHIEVNQMIRSHLLPSNEIQLMPRRIPDRAELEQYEPHLFSMISGNFLRSSRSPCWYVKYQGNRSDDPYKINGYGLYSKRFRAIFEEMRQGFWDSLQLRGGDRIRLRCLPYFYIIGQPKCGTTDLYDRLRLHPMVRFSAFKEPHWWTRKRFGILRLKEPFYNPFPVEDYLDLFDLAAQEIQDHYNVEQGMKGGTVDDLLIGEASASTMWDNSAWSYFYDNVTNTEPPVLIQDFIHAFQPNAKFIIMLRDPVERLYSDYLYFAIANKSAEDFHDKVNESLQMFESCLQISSVRACAYNTTFSNIMPVRLQVGLYVMYLSDWFSLFHMNQFLILRLEDHSANITHSMRLVYDFLHLGHLSNKEETSITHNPASNSRRPDDRSLGPMLPQTRQILKDFYHPYNKGLARLLADIAYLWESELIH